MRTDLERHFVVWRQLWWCPEGAAGRTWTAGGSRCHLQGSLIRQWEWLGSVGKWTAPTWEHTTLEFAVSRLDSQTPSGFQIGVDVFLLCTCLIDQVTCKTCTHTCAHTHAHTHLHWKAWWRFSGTPTEVESTLLPSRQSNSRWNCNRKADIQWFGHNAARINFRVQRPHVTALSGNTTHEVECHWCHRWYFGQSTNKSRFHAEWTDTSDWMKLSLKWGGSFSLYLLGVLCCVCNLTVTDSKSLVQLGVKWVLSFVTARRDYLKSWSVDVLCHGVLCGACSQWVCSIKHDRENVREYVETCARTWTSTPHVQNEATPCTEQNSREPFPLPPPPQLPPSRPLSSFGLPKQFVCSLRFFRSNHNQSTAPTFSQRQCQSLTQTSLLRKLRPGTNKYQSILVSADSNM